MSAQTKIRSVLFLYWYINWNTQRTIEKVVKKFKKLGSKTSWWMFSFQTRLTFISMNMLISKMAIYGLMKIQGQFLRSQCIYTKLLSILCWWNHWPTTYILHRPLPGTLLPSGGRTKNGQRHSIRQARRNPWFISQEHIMNWNPRINVVPCVPNGTRRQIGSGLTDEKLAHGQVDNQATLAKLCDWKKH